MIVTRFAVNVAGQEEGFGKALITVARQRKPWRTVLPAFARFSGIPAGELEPSIRISS